MHTLPLGVLPVDDSTDLCVFQILSISIVLHVSPGFCTLLNAKEKEGGVELGHGGPDLPSAGLQRESCALFRTGMT